MCEGIDWFMKTFRILSSVFCVFGFFFALLGILSSIFPLIENEHFKLILNSFQEASTDPLTNTLNTIVRFCLHSSYFLLLCGISLMVAGGLISSTAHKKQVSLSDFGYDTQNVTLSTSETLGVPKPAYYPGGQESASYNLSSGDSVKIPVLDDAEPLDFRFTDSLKAEPISGETISLFSSYENDVQKLIHNDQQKKAQKNAELQDKPDNEQYLNNHLTDDSINTEKHDIQPPDEPKSHAVDQPPKPRIVSTMGKQRF